jgi:hypothetical protein
VHYHLNERGNGWRGICRFSGVHDRKTIGEMVGEFLREAAVLSAVFVPLDRIMMGDTLTLRWVVSIIVTSGGLLTLGIAAERLRKK